jgi:hypothetical protein
MIPNFRRVAKDPTYIYAHDELDNVIPYVT